MHKQRDGSILPDTVTNLQITVPFAGFGQPPRKRMENILDFQTSRSDEFIGKEQKRITDKDLI
jgi:hypothetical protein